MTRLDDSKIDSEKKRQADGRWTVEVERSSLPEAMREVEKMRLLRDASTAPEASSVIANKDQQRFTFERALSAEIEQTILSLKGVIEARVHLNLPQVDPLFGKAVSGSTGAGSVFIISENQLTFNEREIARLVAGAAGISEEQISVLVEVESVPMLVNVPEAATMLRPISEVVLAYVFNCLGQGLFQSIPLLGGSVLFGLGALIATRLYRAQRVK